MYKIKKLKKKSTVSHKMVFQDLKTGVQHISSIKKRLFAC